MPAAPKTLKPLVLNARSEVADHGVFRVERSDYAGFDRPIFTIACADWCTVIAETDASEIVLVWQYRFGTGALTLETPGGVIDAGERSEDAALRELREETGYEGTTVELVSTTEPNPAFQGNRFSTYLVRGARLAHATQFDPHEDLEVVLVPRTELSRLIDDGTIRHTLVVSALETYLRRRAGS